MDKDYDSLDTEEVNQEELLDEVEENNNIEEDYTSDPNDHLEELGTSTNATGALGVTASTYNKFAQSNLGKALMNHGKNNSYQTPNNNIMNKINANRFNQVGRYQANNNSNNNLFSSTSTNHSSPTSSLDNIVKKPISSLIGGKESTDVLGGSSPIKGIFKSKKFMLLKLKILGIALFFLGLMFVFLFICNVLDVDQGNFLELTTWNTSGSGTAGGTVSSDSNFSNVDKEELKNSLTDKIGDEGITELISKINNSGNNKCDGTNVAQKLVSLIDETGNKGFKIPYGTNSGEYQIVNPDWGNTKEDGSIVGLNEFGVIDWALNTANINNLATNMNDYVDRSRIIDLEYANPGDLVIKSDKGYVIVQNTGENITLAYTDNSGLTYKKYTYNDLSSYSIIDMSTYYKDNCKN